MKTDIEDGVIKGLFLRQRLTKTSWAVKTRVRGGRVVTVTIGDASKITAGNARKEAKLILAKTAQGIDPNAERKQAKEVATARAFNLGEAIKQYSRFTEWKDKTKTDALATLERRFGDWYKKPLADITRNDCFDRFQKIKKDVALRKEQIAVNRKNRGLSVAKVNNEVGVAEAQKAFRYLSAVFTSFMSDDAAGEKLLPNGNPVLVLKDKRVRKVLKPKENYLDINQREDLWQEIRIIDHPEYTGNVKGDDADLVWLLLHTGMRLNEVKNIKWENVDFNAETLTAVDTKNHRNHTLPMTSPIKTVLGRRFKSKTSEYVFPSPFDNEKPMSANETFKRLSKATGFTFTAHDLRRTIATVASDLGYDLDAIGQVLNHKKQSVTSKYIQTTHHRLKTILEDVANAFFVPAPSDETTSEQ